MVRAAQRTNRPLRKFRLSATGRNIGRTGACGVVESVRAALPWLGGLGDILRGAAPAWPGFVRNPCQASSLSITRPPTSVSRKSRPWCR